jgi:hypothetical protein
MYERPTQGTASRHLGTFPAQPLASSETNFPLGPLWTERATVRVALDPREPPDADRKPQKHVAGSLQPRAAAPDRALLMAA